jgi:asparagine synthase (glutamine-hydrolysing)
MLAQSADIGTALDAMPGLFDEPFGDSAAWSNYLVSQFARREVKVALSGEGGDEIFCGYPRYWSDIGSRSSPWNRTLAASLPPLSRFGQSMQRRALVGLPGYAAALGGLTAVQVDALLTPAWRESEYDYLWFYRQFWRSDLPPLVQLRWLDLHTDLAEGLLTKVDRTSMAHSLEVRPPLLDHRLVEFLLSVDRPKSGFGLPVRSWLKRHPGLLQDAVARLRERGVLGRSVGPGFRRAWFLLVLDRWFTAFD